MVRVVGHTSDGVAFAHDGDEEDSEMAFTNAGKQGGKKDKSHVQCRKCKAMGHYANEAVCPMNSKNKDNAAKHESGTQLLTSGVDVDDFDEDIEVSVSVPYYYY
jgi:hypothetical protein